DTVTLQKHQSGSRAGSLVPISERLGLGDVKRVRRSYVEQVSAPVPKGILRRSESRLDQSEIADAFQSTPVPQRLIVQIEHFIQGQEFRFVHNYWESLRN